MTAREPAIRLDGVTEALTVGENVVCPLKRHTRLPNRRIREMARDKLAEVGLADEVHKMPGELSSGMRKRAGQARAMALDPEILLAGEPSAGLGLMPADELATLHEGRVIARGRPQELDRSEDALVRAFMRSSGAG